MMVMVMVTAPPGFSLRVEEDPNFGVARQILGWRGHARTMDNP